MRAAFPGEEDFKSENLFMSRLYFNESAIEHVVNEGNQEFTMPKVHKKKMKRSFLC